MLAVDFGSPETTIWCPQPFDRDGEGVMQYVCLVYLVERNMNAMMLVPK